MTSLMSAASPQTVELKSDWRTEITGRGRYFHFRAGSGKSRRYMRGGRIDKLPLERLEAYKENVTKRKKTKRSAQLDSRVSHRQEYSGEVERVGREILDTEH